MPDGLGQSGDGWPVLACQAASDTTLQAARHRLLAREVRRVDQQVMAMRA